MDKLKQIYKQLSKTEKNALIFDSISHYTFEQAYARAAMLPEDTVNNFFLTSEGILGDFIMEARKKRPEIHSSKTQYSYDVFVPADSEFVMEEREGQKQMIHDIEYSIDNHSVFIGEAPPGTGKSLAYLIPLLKRISEGHRAVVSTNTKNLQMQLFSHDIRIAKDYAHKPFSVCVIKGIGNYLCIAKYQEALLSMSPMTKLALEGFINLTTSGDMGEFRFYDDTDYQDLVSDNEFCMDRDCPFFDRCFFMRIREQARNADLILTNHYLSLIDMEMGNKFFNSYDTIVFDEAHNMESVITELGSYVFSFRYVKRILHFAEKRMTVISHKFKAGNLDMIKDVLLLAENMTTLLDNIETLHLLLQEKIYFEESRRKEYSKALFENMENNINIIQAQLYHIVNESDRLKTLVDEEKGAMRDMFHILRYLHDKSQFMYEAFAVTMQADNEEYAFYYETAKSDKNIEFCGVPVSTGDFFSNLVLNNEDMPVLFASATLGVSGDFELFEKQIGLSLVHRDIIRGVYDTSFNWEEQMKIYCINAMGDPNTEEFLSNAVNFIEHIEKKNKKTLVLTTSYDQINFLKARLKGKDYLFQKKEDTGEVIFEKFKNGRAGILVGTSRFWEGIDLPGDLLEIIVILKMPFAVPDDPVVKKRNMYFEMQEKNPFMHYTLPSAILKLKQGVGRLIRKRTDRGEVYILDERILKKRYGTKVMENLFVKPQIISYKRIMEE